MRSLIKEAPNFFVNETSFIVHIFVFTFTIATYLAYTIYSDKYLQVNGSVWDDVYSVVPGDVSDDQEMLADDLLNLLLAL